jgi:hypothetical protein
MNVNPLDERYSRVARSYGMQNSLRALTVGRAHGLSASLVLAVMEKESNGKNVWGGDRPPNGGTSGLHLHVVTERRYKEYKRVRGSHGQGGMQGVGPFQLTYWTTQDSADARGGCWKPKHNISVALRALALLVDQHGERKALAIYNGGPTNPSWAYADAVERLQHTWHRRLS